MDTEAAPRSGVLQRHGTPIHYRIHGSHDGPLVLCTHGASLDQDAFATNVPALIAAGYRVLTWDLPGHGASQPMGDGFGVESAADDLLALLDTVGSVSTTLVGQSFGGLVSQQLQYEHPERVDAMVMIGSTDLRDPLPRVHAIVQRLRPPLVRVWPDAHLRRTFARTMTDDPDVRDYVERASRRQSKADLIEVTREALRTVLVGRDERRAPLPVLLVHGAQDMELAVGAARRWAEREPASRRVVIPDAGHLANLDQPERFNHVLIAFLRQHLPTSARRGPALAHGSPWWHHRPTGDLRAGPRGSPSECAGQLDS